MVKLVYCPPIINTIADAEKAAKGLAGLGYEVDFGDLLRAWNSYLDGVGVKHMRMPDNPLLLLTCLSEYLVELDSKA